MESTIFFGRFGPIGIWTKDPEHKTFRLCSVCGYTHKLSTGKLPEICPGCGIHMKPARRYDHALLQSLHDDQT